MLYKAINCGQDINKFNILNKKALSYIKKQFNTNAEKWCNPIIHPKTKEIAFTIKFKIANALTAPEIAETIELTDDWFPKEEI